MKTKKTEIALWVCIVVISLLSSPSSAMEEGLSGSLVPENLVMENTFKPGTGIAIGKIIVAAGESIVIHKKGTTGYRMMKNLPLYEGDTLITKRNGRLRLSLKDRSILTMGPDSKLVIDQSVYNPEKKTRSTFMGLDKGELHSIVTKMTDFKHSEFKIKTKTAVAGVRGSEFIIKTDEAVGKIILAAGNGFVIHKNDAKKVPMAKDMPLFEGDTLVTTKNGRMRLMLQDRSILTLGPDTKMVIDQSVYNPDKKTRSTVLGLDKGDVHSLVTKMSDFKHSEFKIKTKTAVAGVRGSEFIVKADETTTEIIILKDTELEVVSLAFPDKVPVLLSDFMSSTVDKNKPPTEGKMVKMEDIKTKMKPFLFSGEWFDLEETTIVCDSKDQAQPTGSVDETPWAAEPPLSVQVTHPKDETVEISTLQQSLPLGLGQVTEIITLKDTELEVVSVSYPDKGPVLLSDFMETSVETGQLPADGTSVGIEVITNKITPFLFTGERFDQEKATIVGEPKDQAQPTGDLDETGGEATRSTEETGDQTGAVEEEAPMSTGEDLAVVIPEEELLWPKEENSMVEDEIFMPEDIIETAELMNLEESASEVNTDVTEPLLDEEIQQVQEPLSGFPGVP